MDHFSAHPVKIKNAKAMMVQLLAGFTSSSPLFDLLFLKLPAYRVAASRKGNFFYIVPLDPAYKAGLAGHLPVKGWKVG